MAESTLNSVLADLRRRIAFEAKYGLKADTSEGLTSSQSSIVDEAAKRGQRRFMDFADWFFKSPTTTDTLWATVTGTVSATGTTVTATVAKFFANMVGKSIVIATIGTFTITAYTSATVVTVSSSATCTANAFTITSDGTYKLPDDFGSFYWPEIAFSPNGSWPTGIRAASEPGIVMANQMQATIGRPFEYGLRPIVDDGTGQRLMLCVRYIPEQNYAVSMRYNRRANALTTGKYYFGGYEYADALEKSCLAELAGLLGWPGDKQERAAMAALSGAAARDASRNRPERLRGVPDTRFGAGRNYRITSLAGPSSINGVLVE